jgi:hypothetical protein
VIYRDDVRLFSLVVVLACAGCSYPEFAFSEDAGTVGVDTTAPEDTRDTFVPPTMDVADVAEVIDAPPPAASCAAIHTASPSLVSTSSPAG